MKVDDLSKDLPQPYGYLRENDGQIQISIGPARPHNRSGGYATPWAAVYATPSVPALPNLPDIKELEAVLEWILKLPVPTFAAVPNAKRVQNAINACRAATQDTK